MPPDSPTITNVTVVSSHSVFISWNALFDGHSNITHFILQIANGTDRLKIAILDRSYTVENLSPYTKYELQVMAVNKIGEGEVSEMKKGLERE